MPPPAQSRFWRRVRLLFRAFRITVLLSILALLGGFRALVADGTWIRMYDVWEERDLPVVDTLIRLVTAIDPRPLYFWLNGARIMAYDMPDWRVAAAIAVLSGASIAVFWADRVARWLVPDHHHDGPLARRQHEIPAGLGPPQEGGRHCLRCEDAEQGEGRQGHPQAGA